MEKRTVLFVVISVAILVGYFFINLTFFPPAPAEIPSATQTAPQAQVLPTGQAVPAPTAGPSAPALVSIAPVSDSAVASVAEEFVQIENDLVRVKFSTFGGDVVSYKLLKHKDGEEPVEMLFTREGQPHAFNIAFGGLNAKPVRDAFAVNRVSDSIIEFWRDYTFVQASGEQTVFRLTKRYAFRPGEYMFELTVDIDGGMVQPNMNFSGIAYTLGFGPQIGPKFEKLSQQYEYRDYIYYANGKKKVERVKTSAPSLLDSRVSWASISGKYFSLIAIPDATQYSIAFANDSIPDISESSRLYLQRPALNSVRTTDVYRFYLGPKTQKELKRYDNAQLNSYKLSEMRLEEVVRSTGFLAPLEAAMKWVLMLFYRMIPNLGVAIILLTLLVRILMFPLSKKASESSIRMQAVAPRIKEIQEKYKDNPNRMNAEMAELYKAEGYNPLSGCLPMLLQIPIFIAMYNMFNNHFDLRGAMFIPGWIPDLSIPESIWNFAPFRIPIVGWSDLRLLPIIYLVSQLLYGKVTMTPDQTNNQQMKMMLYVMPIMFFFILYSVPSGLLLYWIMSNVLTLVQTLFLNKYLAGKRAALKAKTTGPVLVPRRKK